MFIQMDAEPEPVVEEKEVDEEVQRMHREWLRVLFRTPTPILGGRCLAEEPALAIYQLQNESNLLFWNSLRVEGEERRLLGRRFGRWAAERHGSIEEALAAWGGERLDGDHPAAGVLAFIPIWDATAEGMRQRGGRPRCLRSRDGVDRRRSL